MQLHSYIFETSDILTSKTALTEVFKNMQLSTIASNLCEILHIHVFFFYLNANRLPPAIVQLNAINDIGTYYA